MVRGGKRGAVRVPSARAPARARLARARFRGPMELSSDWYWEQDEQFRFTYFSSQFEQKTGLDPATQLGRKRWDNPTSNISAEDWARHRAQLERHESFRDLEMQRKRSDGSLLWVSIDGEPVFDARGRFRGYRGLGRDITERKRAEEALKEGEARFRSLTHLSSDWFWELDAEYRFTRLEGRNVAGGDAPLRERLIGLRRWESGLEIEGGWPAHIALLEARRQFVDVLMWRHQNNGALRYMRLSGEPVFDAAGVFTGYRGVGRDVTLQKREERILRLEHQVALALSEAEDEGTGVRAVLHALCESEGWGGGQYFVLDEAAGVVRFRDAWSLAQPRFERFAQAFRGLQFQPGYGLPGKALQTGDTVWTSDAANDPRVSHDLPWAETGVNGGLAFPVISQGRRIGVLAFVSQTMREPDARLLQATRIIGGQVGQFLQRKRAEDALRESEARFRSLTQMSSDFFWETDERHRFTLLVHGPSYRAKFATAIIGKTSWDLPYSSPDEAGWDRLRAALDAHESFREFEFGRPRTEGGSSYFSVSGEPRFSNDGRFIGYRGIGRDITELVIARQHVASLAYSDSLTGLSNRTSLGPAFEQAVERARRRGARLAALFIDLDGFKQINDAHGHQAGDRFLVETGRRLRASVRASDLVARLGGDEFFAVLEDVQEIETAETVARKLLAEILRPVELVPGVLATASASIGISVFPDDAEDAGTMMRHADRAMYQAKQAGKNDLRFYAESPAAGSTPVSRSEAA